MLVRHDFDGVHPHAFAIDRQDPFDFRDEMVASRGLHLGPIQAVDIV